MAEHNNDDPEEKKRVVRKGGRKRTRRKQSAKAKAATRRNLKKAQAAVRKAQKASGKKRAPSKFKRKHRGGFARKPRARVTRVAQTFAGGVSAGFGRSLTSLELPVAGNTPVPTFPRLTAARAGDAGMRRPSLNGNTIGGDLLVPRATDGLIADIRMLHFAKIAR